MDASENDYFALLSALGPDALSEMFTPYAQQQGVLDQEMALAAHLRQPRDSGQHVSPIGAALGGLGDAVGNVAGAYQQRKGLEEQRTLNSKMQGDATHRMQAMLDARKKQQDDERERALQDFLRQRGDAMGFNRGITNWGG